jgi:peptidoglycan/xylan/chitin deacetylase (PgdA/CDA1 family)
MKHLITIISIVIFSILTSCQFKSTDQAENNDSIQTSQIEKVKPVQIENNAAQILAKPQVPVLCYHRIEAGRKDDYTESPETFAAHMQVLADSGYTSILLPQLYDYLLYNKALPEKPVIITFDDSRVEHYEIAAKEMEKRGFRGVFFIMTITYNKKNYMSTDQIAALSKAGHEIGLHSWDHTMASKYLTDEDWKKNVINPKEKLEGFIGKAVDYWAYPYGISNRAAMERLDKIFKMSFILSTKRDSVYPLQTVRRMIAPEISQQSLIKSMKRSF